MKREFIKGLLGEAATKEIIDAIMEENGKDIEAEKAKTTLLQTQLDAANVTVKERDKQLDNLKNSTGDVEQLKSQIEQLQNDNKIAKDNFEKELNNIKIDSAIERALVIAKAKNVKAVKALLDLNDAKLNDDGSIDDLDKKIAELQKNEDYLFEKVEQKLKGTNPSSSDPNPSPSGNKSDAEKTYQDWVNELSN